MSIKPIKVSHEVVYDEGPIECYMKYCKEYDDAPTQSGFIEWCSDYIQEDFGMPSFCVEIEVIDKKDGT